MSTSATHRQNKRFGLRQSISVPLVVLALWLLDGCIVVPVPVNYHKGDSRQNVRTKDTRWLISGQTTREEVLLRLGEPDEATEDGASLTYRWEKKYLQLWAVWGAGNTGGGEYRDLGKDYALKLSFDPTGKLTRCAVQKSELKPKASHSF